MLSQGVLSLVDADRQLSEMVDCLKKMTYESHAFLRSANYPDIYKSALYLIEKRWLIQMPRDPMPTSTHELLDKIRFVSTPIPREGIYIVESVRECFAAIMYLVPALGRIEGLQSLWLLIEQLSYVYTLCMDALGRIHVGRMPGDYRHDQQGFAPHERIPLPEDLKPIVYDVLSILDTLSQNYFFESTPPIQNLDPRILCSASEWSEDQTIELQLDFGQLPITWHESFPSPEEMMRESNKIYNQVQAWSATRYLIFSGGFNTTINVKYPEADFSRNVWHVIVNPVGSLVETTAGGKIYWRLQPGPVSFIDQVILPEIKNFLHRTARSLLTYTTDRFWIPLNPAPHPPPGQGAPEEAYPPRYDYRNLIWIGPPIINLQNIPQWTYVGVFTKAPPQLELWGTEDLKTWMDGEVNITLTKPIVLNYECDGVMLLHSMKMGTTIINGVAYNVLLPYRYDIRILAENHCGVTDKSFNKITGVTYPLKTSFLGAEVGQTISQGSISNNPDLQHQPAIYFQLPFIDPLILPLTPPIVSTKPTFIRIFMEHNAPPPYFSPNAGFTTNAPKSPLSARLDYTIRSYKTGTIESGSADGMIQYEEVLALSSGEGRQRFHSMRTRGYNSVGVFSIPLAAHFGFQTWDFVSGKFDLKGTVDIAEPTKTQYGLFRASSPVELSFNITDPTLVSLYWIPVIPTGGATGNPILRYDEWLVLEEWLQYFVPSIVFTFTVARPVTMKPGESADDLLKKVEQVQRGRDGFWIAIIDDTLATQCDSSISKWDGSAYYGTRRAWVKLFRNRGGSVIDTVRTIAHEFCHAHPAAYKHIFRCNDSDGNPPADAINGSYYCRPGYQFGYFQLYPQGTCGESLFITADGLPNPFTNIGGTPFRWPNILEYTIISEENSREIMTYCANRGFDVYKCCAMATYYDELLYNPESDRP